MGRLRRPRHCPFEYRPRPRLDGLLDANTTRATLVWPDNAIRGKWLQVTVTAPGMAAPDVFYFGNAPGESGADPASAAVDANDEIAARNNPRTFSNPAGIGNNYDFNRDGFVNAADQIIARSNPAVLGAALRLIHPTALAALVADNDPIGDAALIAFGLASGIQADDGKGAMMSCAAAVPSPSSAVSTELADQEQLLAIFAGLAYGDSTAGDGKYRPEQLPQLEDELVQLLECESRGSPQPRRTPWQFTSWCRPPWKTCRPLTRRLMACLRISCIPRRRWAGGLPAR